MVFRIWQLGYHILKTFSEKGFQDININRTEEALSLNPDIIATGCPFCNTMMTDGVKNLAEGNVEVLDIAELIAEAEGL